MSASEIGSEIGSRHGPATREKIPTDFLQFLLSKFRQQIKWQIVTRERKRRRIAVGVEHYSDARGNPPARRFNTSSTTYFRVMT